MDETLQFDRLENIYTSRGAVLKKLDTLTFLYAQPVIARYSSMGSIKYLLAIGTKDGKYEIMGDSSVTDKVPSSIYTYTSTTPGESVVSIVTFALQGNAPILGDILIVKREYPDNQYITSYIFSGVSWNLLTPEPDTLVETPSINLKRVVTEEGVNQIQADVKIHEAKETEKPNLLSIQGDGLYVPDIVKVKEVESTGSVSLNVNSDGVLRAEVKIDNKSITSDGSAGLVVGNLDCGIY